MVASEHQAACHFAEEALQSDVGVAHTTGDAGMRRGTPESATAGLEAEQAAAAVASSASAAPASDAAEMPNAGTTDSGESEG